MISNIDLKAWPDWPEGAVCAVRLSFGLWSRRRCLTKQKRRSKNAIKFFLGPMTLIRLSQHPLTLPCVQPQLQLLNQIAARLVGKGPQQSLKPRCKLISTQQMSIKPCDATMSNSISKFRNLWRQTLPILAGHSICKKKLLYCRQIREFQLLNARLRNLAMQRKPMHF